MTRRRSGNVD